MLTFDKEDCRFNYRVAGVAIDERHVLMHRAENESFWTLPGGRVEMGEASEQALVREMKEELGVDVEIQRLLWVVENFFEYSGMKCHELAFYYLMKLPRERGMASGGACFSGLEEFYEGNPVIPLIFQWTPLESIRDLNVLPSFLGERLADLPDRTEHLVHVDGAGEGETSV